MTTFLAEKSRTYKYVCEKCYFKCNDKRDYERHLGTAKHKKQHSTTEEQNKKLECICGKKYKERTALYRHKKKCNYKTPEEILKDEMKDILKKQNEEQSRRDQEQRRLIEQQREQQRIRDEEHKQQIEVLTEKISGISGLLYL